MALIVKDPRGPGLDQTQAYHLYCCNDSRVTRAIFDTLHPLLGDQEKFYDATMAFLSPTLAMSLRGICVDEKAVTEALRLREGEERDAITVLRKHPQVAAIWDEKEPWDNQRDGFCMCNPKKLSLPSNHSWFPRGVPFAEQVCLHCAVSRSVVTPLNPHSSQQMARLLYGKLEMQVRRDRKTGEVTTKDDALQALALKYTDFAPLLDAILAAREARKQVSLLKSRRDTDGRWRSSFNVSAAETDRMSSSKSPYRSGGNTQNVADRSRNIFVPDPGLTLFYIDLEQAESRIVANDAQCDEDIEDHASGDVHTTLCRRIWKDRPWTGDLARDKVIAGEKAPWDPEHDLRHYGKIIRHGTNIGMTHVGIAREAHISQKQAREMRDAYFAAYPGDYQRQQEIRRMVRETGVLTNPLGRTRLFLGRLWDEDTMKEALAQTQQSTIAWVLNVAMWRIWYELDGRLNLGTAPNPRDPNRVWLLGQIHDAVLGLVRPGDSAALLRMREIMETPVVVRGVPVVIPAEIMLGSTWRKGTKEEPGELKVWKPSKT